MAIIDFHTHPFLTPEESICRFPDACHLTAENTRSRLESLGITHICGSVLTNATYANEWERITAVNERALELEKFFNGFYTPGFHIHPAYVKESCALIEKMAESGHRLIGEICPYLFGWEYGAEGQDEILHVAEEFGMIVSFHTDSDNDALDQMVKKHPGLTFVAAHPGEKAQFLRHLERMTFSENYYLDVSGTGIYREGVLRYGIDQRGADRFLFGTDFPICSPASFVGAVRDDYMLSDVEKEAVLAGNAKRLLQMR